MIDGGGEDVMKQPETENKKQQQQPWRERGDEEEM